MNKENNNLAWFTILSYIDKGVSFVLPLSVLYFFNDKITYNKLEYAYSIANIAVYLFSVGSMYSFYGYKKSNDKQQYVSDYLLVSCVSVLVVSVLTAGVALFILDSGNKLGIMTSLLIAARITLLLFVNLFSMYFRLIDRPSMILIYNISINIIIAILLFILYFSSTELLLSFTMPELIIPPVLCIGILIVQRIKFDPYVLFNYYKRSIKFAWPVVLNCLLGLGVTNFGKIYAFNRMSPDDMYIFSYTMRISLIIGMAHTSIVAFYSKDIYTNKFTSSVALKYLFFLFSSAVISFLIIIFLNLFLPQKLPVDFTMFILFLYNIVFFAGSFCEAFYGRNNNNKILLIVSLISFGIFAIFILMESNMTLLSISLIMLFYSFSRFFLMLFGIKDFRHLIFNKL